MLPMLDRIVSGEIPERLRGDTHEAEMITERLDGMIIGQKEAKRAIANAISDSVNRVTKKKGPLAVLLFRGPTGTGKTESVRAIAKIMLGNEHAFVKMQGEQFQEPHSVSRLLGSPPGYVGHGSTPPLFAMIAGAAANAIKNPEVSYLARRIRGFNILLVDEVEKVHPSVIQSMLGAFDDGICQLSNNTYVDLSSTLVIMTSNVGEKEKREQKRPPMGFVGNGSYDEKRIMAESMKAFSPEMLGRIDSVVDFKPITKSDAVRIVEKFEAMVNSELESYSPEFTRLRFEMSRVARKTVAEMGFSEEKGARELRRAFDRHIDVPLGKILRHFEEIMDFPEMRATVIANARKGRISFSIPRESIRTIESVSRKTAKLLTNEKKNEKRN